MTGPRARARAFASARDRVRARARARVLVSAVCCMRPSQARVTERGGLTL